MANGDVYEGEWVNEEMCGVGTKTSPDGTAAYVVSIDDDFVVVQERKGSEKSSLQLTVHGRQSTD